MNLLKYLEKHGVSLAVVSKHPDTAAEFCRAAFLQQNYENARKALFAYLWFVAAVPVTAPAFYFVRPSPIMLVCSIGFGCVVTANWVAQIIQKRRAKKDYLGAMQRLVRMVKVRQLENDEA